MKATVGRELAAFAFFLALAVALTWPLAINLDTSVPDRGDPLLTAWILDWVCHALTHDPLNLYHAPIYHPARYALAFSENMIGIALQVLPLHLLGAPALVKLNIAVLLGFAFSGYGAWVLARLVTGCKSAALVAGIFYAFASFKAAHVQHIQIISSGWLPLLLAALLVYWRKPDRKRAVLLGGAFVMNGLTSVHWLLFGGVTLIVTIGVLALAEPRRERAFWLRLFGALTIASLLLLPVLLPYQIVSNEYRLRRVTGEARGGSATVMSWLVPTDRNAFYGPVAAQEFQLQERELFPGLLVLFLAAHAFLTMPRREGDPSSAFGTFSPRRGEKVLDGAIVASAVMTYVATASDRVEIGRLTFSGNDVPAMLTVILLIVRFLPQLRAAAARSRFSPAALAGATWIVIGFFASLGWNFFLHPFLFRVIVPFRATRTPARWAVIVYVGLALWAALGMSALLARRAPRMRRLLGVALVLFAILEVRMNIHWDHVDAKIAPVYRWLAQARPRAAFELPMIADGIPFEYLLWSTEHRVPLINGTSGWETRLHEMLRKKELKLQYDDAFLAALAKNGAEVVIVHESRLTPEQKTALVPFVAKLEPIARSGSDAVYRIRTRR